MCARVRVLGVDQQVCRCTDAAVRTRRVQLQVDFTANCHRLTATRRCLVFIYSISMLSTGAHLQYLTTILRLSCDNAKVTIDLRRTTILPNRLTNGERLFLGMVHLQNRKRSYDKLTIILR